MKNFSIYVGLFVILSVLSFGDIFHENEEMGKRFSNKIKDSAALVTNHNQLKEFKKSTKKILEIEIFKNLKSSLKKDFFEEINLENLQKETRNFCTNLDEYIIVSQNVEKLKFLKYEVLDDYKPFINGSFEERLNIKEKYLTILNKIKSKEKFKNLYYNSFDDIEAIKVKKEEHRIQKIQQISSVEDSIQSVAEKIINNYDYLLNYSYYEKFFPEHDFWKK